MNTRNHPIDAEELMAYLDGELAPEQGTVISTHLDDCAECQTLAADLRSVSDTMKTWTIEAPADSKMTSVITAAVDEHVSRREAERMPAPAIPMPWGMRVRELVFENQRRTIAVLSIILVVACATVVPKLFPPKELLTVNTPGRLGGYQSATQQAPRTRNLQGSQEFLMRQREMANLARNPAESTGGIVGGIAPPAPQKTLGPAGSFSDKDVEYSRQQYSKPQSQPAAGPENFRKMGGAASGDRNQLSASNAAGPMIVRTAALGLTTKEFDAARARIEITLQKRDGYLGSLNVTANPGAGRTLTAILRVPSTQLTDTLTELKTLGRLDSESQTGEDVTSQYVDLEARLANSRHTEQRLIDLLANRTGKLSDVLDVENELARVRGEIESMEAERKTMANQVDFATINLTINEDYRAQLQVVPPSTTTRLINAAVAGYRGVTDSVMSVALFFLESGPTLLLWLAVLFFPARYAWKKLRTT